MQIRNPGVVLEWCAHGGPALLAELATGRPGLVAEASWEALISISAAWREDRDLPEGMRELMPVMPR
ncbi:hypothetical protein ABT215_07700 [Streptomyces sp900105755]|uniref:hypothetical protein n=1 Tax=Streptomyces sp. 900105755 TaxID=3154389 RepID=UPI0033206D8E